MVEATSEAVYKCPVISVDQELYGAPFPYHGECWDPGYTLDQMRKHLVDDNDWTDERFKEWMLTLPGAYRCEHCEGVFIKGWSNEEAEAESAKQWGSLDKKDLAQVCDRLLQRIHEMVASRGSRNFQLDCCQKSLILLAELFQCPDHGYFISRIWARVPSLTVGLLTRVTKARPESIRLFLSHEGPAGRWLPPDVPFRFL